MDTKLFRKKSYDNISSPEDLSNYIHVTTISVWAVLITIVIAMVALLGWGSVMSIESKAYGKATVKDKSLVIVFDDQEKASNITDDMTAEIEGISFALEKVEKKAGGEIVASGFADLADGEYDAYVGYKKTQIISMLFN